MGAVTKPCASGTRRTRLPPPFSGCFVTSSRCGEDAQVRPCAEEQTSLPGHTKVRGQSRQLHPTFNLVLPGSGSKCLSRQPHAVDASSMRAGRRRGGETEAYAKEVMQ